MRTGILRQRKSRGGHEGGFTMVEIALSIAVVAFALVAIMGVLPTGMTVQKENREDTLINQEGRFWLETIRSGARGMHDLTNYVEMVQVITNYVGRIDIMPADTVRLPNGSTVPAKGEVYKDFATKPITPLELIALLSLPKYDTNGLNNNVIAQVKAITGLAVEKGSLTNEYSFRYQLQTEIIPDISLLMALPNGAFAARTGANPPLFDVRLVLRWPVTQRGDKWIVGNNKKTFRAKIAGSRLSETNISTILAKRDYRLIVPNQF